LDAHAAAITLCAAAAAGIFLIALADRLRVPSIALLLLGGILLGPEAAGLVDPYSLGAGLETVVTLAVAVVLFEGGLTLDIAGFRREPTVIIRMLTLGVLVTWAGTALAIYLIYGVELEVAIICGSLVIVTGPTVVSPILRRIGVQPRLHHILYWEGVLVDAVGVFVAVLCYEWIASSSDQPLLAPLGRFASRFAIGAGVGVVVGVGIGEILRRRWISHEHVNIVVLASALLALAIANAILPEAGILSVIVAGLVLSLRSAGELKRLKQFKLELTEVGIGLLFVLLAARLDLSVFLDDAGALLAVLAVILFVLRPVNVLLATWGQGFSIRERTFLAWLAPRGIVAASMASLFSLRLAGLGYDDAALLETVTYAVIGTTVVLQGLSAPTVAGMLGLQRRSRATWLLIGDPDLAVELHRQLRQAGARSLVLAGASDAEALGDDANEAVWSESLGPELVDDPRIADVEAVLALASNPATNDAICEAWSAVVGPAACYRWDGRGAVVGSSLGRAVWRKAPTPAQVKAGIDGKSCALETVEVGDRADTARFGDALRPLLAVDDGRISLVTADEVPAEAQSVVVVRQRTPGLYGLIRDAVIIDQREVTFEETVRALLEQAAQTSPGLPTDQHLAEILDRERSIPTTVGGGVAIPHVYDQGIERSSAFVANVSGQLDLIGPDDVPVRLVFLVISPVGRATEHLRSLGALARLANDPALVEVLARQRTRGRLLTLLRERE
jgi:NhaP-type Na+/H+ or K+/H+ antiporter/mannitol/fructose-specific phosphotransferase system IIA component (Ntr-type)